jgi:hypothetical protein
LNKKKTGFERETVIAKRIMTERIHKRKIDINREALKVMNRKSKN